ncbi:MAG: DASH family cryptochrome [Candidatus Caenarcaniphilales bacterium]|nr:DASH family cryptochrome [Candidatus Caenarcaniphilales bacterium]
MSVKSLIWFRKNLRIFDNQCLDAALRNSDKTVAVFIIEPSFFEDTKYGFKRLSDFRLSFLYESIEQLKANLELLNIHLNIILGDSFSALSKIIKEEKITDLYYEKDIAAEERALEKKVKKTYSNINFNKFNANYIFKYDEIKSKVKRLQDTFTKFRKYHEQDFLESEKVMTNTKYNHQAESISLNNENYHNDDIKILDDLQTLKNQIHVLSDTRATFIYKGGEEAGLDRIKSYIWEQKSIKRYKRTRNGLMGRNFSSRFSAWLANGSISVNFVMHEIEKFENEVLKNDSTYWLKFELLWREYFRLLYGKYKKSSFFLNGPHEREVYNELDEDLCSKWINGKTGQAFIDANMICLKQTGYLSNRGRQNVVAYFIHELKQDWRFAASYLESMLVDYDIFSNWLNCSYIAGLMGTEKAHKFDLNHQIKNYDPKGQFIKHWLDNEDLS